MDATCLHIDNALLKVIAHAHRWKRMIESGRFASLTELAEAETINRSHLCRILRLTLLAPEVVEAIVDGAAITVARRCGNHVAA